MLLQATFSFNAVLAHRAMKMRTLFLNILCSRAPTRENVKLVKCHKIFGMKKIEMVFTA